MNQSNLMASCKDPCGPIQADLSAMLDGELDAATVRRVMVHSDICQACSSFLTGIRNQARAHKVLSGVDLVGTALGTEAEACILDPVEAGRMRVGDFPRGRMGKEGDKRARQLGLRLLENQRQLARILYELGRGFVLMGVSPNFSRVVAREPVPVPDAFLRGKHLLDEVQRLGEQQQVPMGQEWVRARTLFQGQPATSPEENLAKGKRLLREALMLVPDFHAARIYLGQAYQVEGNFGRARSAYQRVLAESGDRVMCAYALENLGNVHLEEGRPLQALPYFLQLLESGILELEPRFHTTFFNLALAYGLLQDFDRCEMHLTSLYEGFPHRRRLLAREISRRHGWLQALRQQPHRLHRLAERFPCWFQAIAKEEC